jgi:hypothetical protein
MEYLQGKDKNFINTGLLIYILCLILDYSHEF